MLVNEGAMCLSIGPCCEWQHRAEVLNVKGARFCLMKWDPDLHDNVLGISLTIQRVNLRILVVLSASSS